MNTQIKGQQGYKKNEIFDKLSEAEQIYSQYKWIIKWENKCPLTKTPEKTPPTEKQRSLNP